MLCTSSRHAMRRDATQPLTASRTVCAVKLLQLSELRQWFIKYTAQPHTHTQYAYI